MTSNNRAKRINKLLVEANTIQEEAKRINGRDCFNFKSVNILAKLYKQIDLAITEMQEELLRQEAQRDQPQIHNH